MIEEQRRIEWWFVRLYLKGYLSNVEWNRWMPLLWQLEVTEAQHG